MMKKILIISVLVMGVGIPFSFCGNSHPMEGYDLTAPEKTYVLPDILHEISGLTDISETEIACVQDELGIVFIYDLEKSKVTEQIQFSEEGDYEGITMAGKDIYILRSDGQLIEIKNFRSSDRQVNYHKTDIPAKDNEGLGFDSKNKRLLIGCKSKVGKGKEFANHRAVYGFDLKDKKMSKKPVLEIQLSDVIKFAKKNNVELPTKTKKGVKKSALKLGISAIAIHPKSGDTYLLSAVDHLIIVLDRKNEIKQLRMLDEKKFPQAEGLTFLPDGTMLISNEGANQKPTIFSFKQG